MLFKKNNDFIAQGTIEYLVILAIIIVIGLVFVGMLVSMNDSGNIISKNNDLKNLIGTGGISVLDSVIDLDDSGLIVLKNNSGELLTLNKILINGVESDFDASFPNFSNLAFYLNQENSNCSCDAFERKKECEVSIYYTNKYGVKKQESFKLTFDCQEKNNPKPETIYSNRFALGVIGEGYTNIVGVTTDLNDNIYVVGNFYDSISFGDFDLTPLGDSDIFVAKLNGNTQKWEWAVSAGRDGYSYGRGVVVDLEGNVYVVGSFSGDATFGNINVNGVGNSDGFVAKLNSFGEWQWVHNFGDSSYDNILNSIVFDSQENLYVAGGGGEINLAVIVAKVNKSDGSFDWNATGTGLSFGYTGLTVLSDGNLAIVGNYQSGLYNQDFNFGNIRLPLQEGQQIFVAKLSSDGQWIWANANIGSGYNGASSIISDSYGYLYIGGSVFTQDGFHFGNLQFNPSLDLEEFQFIAKINSDNNAGVWANFVDNSDFSYPYDLMFNSLDKLYMCGNIYGQTTIGSTSFNAEGGAAYIGRINKDTNAWISAKYSIGPNSESCTVITKDSKNRIIAVGSFNGDTNFDGKLLSSNGQNNIFVWRFEDFG
ncbi:MAG: hypothetical protein WC915_05780 [archaeon]|jgi:hypothetical protein